MARDLSIVIPLHDEAPNLEQLYRELTETLSLFGRDYELVFVDDGSTDATFDLLKNFQADDSRIRVVRFRRNFGQTAAFSAGFAQASGRFAE